MNNNVSKMGLYALPKDEYHKIRCPGFKYAVDEIVIKKKKGIQLKLRGVKELIDKDTVDLFDSIGYPVDIDKDARFNPYIQYKMA